jgi:hypothetical protein
MSALGQKPTYALQQAMSALPPIATAKAKFHMSALAAKADMCGAQPMSLWAKSGHRAYSITSSARPTSDPQSRAHRRAAGQRAGVPGAPNICS